MFRRTKSGLRLIAPLEERSETLRIFQDEIGHWVLDTTKQFIRDRFWWYGLHKDAFEFVKSCYGCQKFKSVRKCKSTLNFPISAILKSFSVDFEWSFRKTSKGNNYILIGLEYFTEWPMGIPVEDATLEVVLKFEQEQIIEPFGFPKRIISDNALCFTATAVTKFTEKGEFIGRRFLLTLPCLTAEQKNGVGDLKRGIEDYIRW